MSDPANSSAGLGEDARDVERDVARADHHRAGPVQRRGEVGEIGMAVIPADERRRPITPGRSSPGMPSGRSAGAPVASTTASYSAEQLGDRHVRADGDVADEADVVAERGRLVAAADALDRLMVGRDPGADQAIGHGQAVDDVDAAPSSPNCFWHASAV